MTEVACQSSPTCPTHTHPCWRRGYLLMSQCKTWLMQSKCYWSLPRKQGSEETWRDSNAQLVLAFAEILKKLAGLGHEVDEHYWLIMSAVCRLDITRNVCCQFQLTICFANVGRISFNFTWTAIAMLMCTAHPNWYAQQFMKNTFTLHINQEIRV